jgi:hypothetical protein
MNIYGNIKLEKNWQANYHLEGVSGQILAQ